MTISIQELAQALAGRELPGGELVVESHESAIADEALRSRIDPDGIAHPGWFVIASLRGMGISVDELCTLAEQGPDDLLLFGNCTVEQVEPMRVGARYRTHARIGEVSSRTTRDGSRLDSVVVHVDVVGDHGPSGSVVSDYLFKRGVS